MKAAAHAKVNLSLRVGSARGAPLHPISTLMQSIDWTDRLELVRSDDDRITTPRGAEVIDGRRNLAWRALLLVREDSGRTLPMKMVLDKRIPVAAGLGGGSADAAAALALSGRAFGVGRTRLAELAPQLGSDVPFCFRGGKAMVGGSGESIEPLEAGDDYALAVVVPPIEISTADVYAAWDELEGPKGPAVDGRSVPPPLRALGPLVNDLYPAAVAVAPTIDDWRSELEERWGRPVMMSGSGSALFGFFVDRDEAVAAARDVPAGARAADAATPLDRGWQILPE